MDGFGKVCDLRNKLGEVLTSNWRVLWEARATGQHLWGARNVAWVMTC